MRLQPDLMVADLPLTHTRVAAEGQFSSGCVGLGDVEIPVFVNAHRGSVSVPAGVGEQKVLKARQHLSGRTGDYIFFCLFVLLTIKKQDTQL